MKDNRGFTLIEVLLSIIILGVILVSFFQFFIFSQNTTTSNQDKLVAINIAQKVLEQIKEDSRTAENSPHSDYWEITHPSIAGNYQPEYGPYQENVDNIQYQIMVKVGNELDNGLRMVTVTVSMKGAAGKSMGTVKGLVEL